MSDFTVKDVRQAMFRLSNTTGSDYVAEREYWDKNSIAYAGVLLEALETVQPERERK